jgi:hypothetical protein
MKTYDRALTHCSHLPAEGQQLYMLGFNAGLRAASDGDDTDGFFRSLISADHLASAAGFLEGCAAANLDVPVLRKAADRGRWRNDSRAYRKRAVA